MSLPKEFPATNVIQTERLTIFSSPVDSINIIPNLEPRLSKWLKPHRRKSICEPEIRKKSKPTTIVEFPSVDIKLAA